MGNLVLDYETLADAVNRNLSILFVAVATPLGVCIVVRRGNLARCIVQIEMLKEMKKQFIISSNSELGVICVQ
jgi:hypothetical protein